MTDIADRLARLTPAQRALLNELLDQPTGELTFPLSVFQEGMWLLEQLHPGNEAYIGISAVEISDTELDVDRLRGALAALTQAHEVARTTFAIRDGRPAQVVHPVVAVDIPEVELTGASQAELLEAVRALVLDTPFDISARPPVRLGVIRTGPRTAILAAAAHHLIFDRQAFGFLLATLSECYEALGKDDAAVVPSPRLQYGDFSSWQVEQRTRGAWNRDLEYWREQLRDAPPSLTLPTDRPRSAVQGLRGDQIPVHLPAAVMERLTHRAREVGATPYMVLLSAFAMVLRRWSGQDDVVIGSPASMRDRADIGDLLGYFINTLPIRVRVTDDDTLGGLVGEVRTACLDAYSHNDVPFDAVVADLQAPRDLSRTPVYQASLTYGREPTPAHGFGGRMRRIFIPSRGARFDVEIQAFHQGGALDGYLEYDADLFDRSTMQRLVGHFESTCSTIAESLDVTVGEVEIVGDAERARLVSEFNDTAQAWPAEPGWVPDHIDAMVAATPDAVAVVFGEEQVTYRELDERANALAHALRAAGVGRDSIVAVALERSIELVVSLVAVVKAGGAYLPLDLHHPIARLLDIITESQARILLTDAGGAARLDHCGTECWDVAAVCAEAGRSDAAPVVDRAGDDLVYVIYTSGSTGRPKGVMNTHRGLRNRLLWMQEAFPLGAQDRVLQKTPYTFDVSVWEFFWPLMTGASIVVAEPGGHRDPAYLRREIARREVTTLHFVPSLLRAFLDGAGDLPACVRRVICSGEALGSDLRDRFVATSPAELHNLYGPTEAAIDVTHWDCRRTTLASSVPIGSPISNTQVHILDARSRLVPLGAVGEIHLGGDNLARGYLGRPDLTEERFIANPVDPARSPRLYRTGDAGRWLPDGTIEYIGRLDDQVKLRGQRIELGEIEAALLAHEAVTEAVVVTRELRPGDVRLVGYLVGVPGAEKDTARVRSHLQGVLPDYMIPTHIHWLDAMPLSSNGKLDRGALPAPRLDPGERAAFTPPADATERALATIWAQALGVADVGRDDNFFDLGGHSLLLAEVQAKVQEMAGREVGMVALFQNPTIATLAAHLDAPAPDTSPAQDADHRGRVRRDAQRQRLDGARRRAAARGETGRDA